MIIPLENISNIFVKYIELRTKLNDAEIYKITYKSNNNIYIGSTCKTLKQILTIHERHYKCFLK